jgi:hypothetical protein
LILLTAAVLAVSSTCADGPAVVPQAGTLSLLLATPNVDDGAVLFEVSGPPIDSATAVGPSLRLFTHQADGSRLVGVVAGPITSGPLLTLYVRDTGAVAAYTARVLEVADRLDSLRASLTGYTATVTLER